MARGSVQPDETLWRMTGEGSATCRLPAAVHARLRLLASELVTSAVTCRASTAEPVVQLEIEMDDETVRLRVERVRSHTDPIRDSLGRSPQWTLALLDEMADAWGVVHDECGRHLRSWAELRVGG